MIGGMKLEKDLIKMKRNEITINDLFRIYKWVAWHVIGEIEYGKFPIEMLNERKKYWFKKGIQKLIEE